MIWILKEKNYAVTEYYFSILKQAAEIVCDDVRLVDEIRIDQCNPSIDLIIVGSITKAAILFLKGYENIIVWFQGVVPEESYTRNNSIIRKRILEIIEKKVLEKTCLAIFVSQAMKEHYEKKYKLNFENRYYVMPCFNTEILRESFFKSGKYGKNIFAYTGGLSPWQNFDKVLACYQYIEKLGIPNTKLLVLTPEKDKALEEIQKTSIKNYEIGYARVEDLPFILADAKFGFVIRDNVVINQVSTPTKVSTYIANGLIPIYSECIRDFHAVSSGFKYRLSLDSVDFYDRIQYFMMTKINTKSIYNEYSNLFEIYYNTNYHRQIMSTKIKQLLYEE